MSGRMAVTLSCGDNGALGPPISVLTQPGLTKTQVMPRGAQIDRRASHHDIYGRLGTAIGDGATRPIFSERAHATRDGDHEPSRTPGNVIARRIRHLQGTHRIHIEHVNPGFAVDIAGFLPRHTGDPRAVDEHVYIDVLELRCGDSTLSASVTSSVLTVGPPFLFCAKRRSSLAVAGLRQAVSTRDPSVAY